MVEPLDQLQAENVELRARLDEAEETLRAIREGEVDAVVVSGSKGDRVFALSEAENFSRLMVETMNEAGLAVTPDGLLIFANARANALLGHAKEHFLGNNLGEFVAPVDADRFRQLLQITAQGDARIEFVTATGASVPMHVWASRLERPEGPLICLVATDLSRVEADRNLIDQLKQRQEQLRAARVSALNLTQDAVAARQQAEQAEVALRTSEERERLRAAELQTVLETAPIAMWIAHDPECRRITGNAAADRLLQAPRSANISASAVPGEAAVTYKVFRGDSELGPDQMPAQLATATGKPVMGEELTLVFADGRKIHLIESAVPLFDANGRVRSAVVAGEDITERKQAEAELERERQQLWAIIESLDEAVGVWNTDGSLVLINDATAKLYGFEMKEQMLKHLSDYADVQVRTMDGCELPPEEWPPSRVLRGETFSNWELEQYIPSINKRFIGSNSGRPVRDASGKVILGVTSVRDITERKQAEEALRTSRRAAINLMRDAVAAREETEQSNAKLRTSNEDLTRFNRTAVDRELRMIELKKQVNELCVQVGKPRRYNVEYAEKDDPSL